MVWLQQSYRKKWPKTNDSRLGKLSSVLLEQARRGREGMCQFSYHKRTGRRSRVTDGPGKLHGKVLEHRGRVAKSIICESAPVVVAVFFIALPGRWQTEWNWRGID